MTDSTGQRIGPDPIGTSSQDLASVRPGRLLLRTGRACDIDPQHLIDVFGEQRRRFVTVLQGFGPGDWAAPTRCADWPAHDIVRHLCDKHSAWVRWVRSGRPNIDARSRRPARRVPIPPELVALLREHIAQSCTGTCGRLFRSQNGNPIQPSTWWHVWQKARAIALTPAQAATPPLRRPYDYADVRVMPTSAGTSCSSGVKARKLSA